MKSSFLKGSSFNFCFSLFIDNVVGEFWNDTILKEIKLRAVNVQICDMKVSCSSFFLLPGSGFDFVSNLGISVNAEVFCFENLI